MCAISGVIGHTLNDLTINKMLETMHRRGPDGKGIFRFPEGLLLHSRLSIIDPEKGKQPMELNWMGETYIITYNGELYNTDQLRDELRSLGHTFNSHSDTEVLLHSYAQWSDACLNKLNGIYAFAIWEKNAKRLFMARDRMGVKPLFYYLGNGFLAFASEIKTLLCNKEIKPELDQEGIFQILLLGPGRKPGSGVFKNVLELEPGYCASYEAGQLHIRRYWRLNDAEHTESFTDTVEHVRALVLDAITRQMVSDVPLGTFLSGGLDSSIITAICAKAYADRGEQLHTFSVDYENNDRYFVSEKFQPSSDYSYIQVMREHCNTAHTQTVLTPEDLISAMEDATIARDLPGMADVDFSLLAFCKPIRRQVKVALSGECADEIFGGYPWYHDPQIREQDGFPWSQNLQQRLSFLRPDLTISNNAVDYIKGLYSDTLRDCDILPGAAPLEVRIKQMVNLNQRWFMQTLLDRKDRMSMYQSLEVRVPFCDHRIAEYLYTVPWAFRNYGGKEKGLLREAVADLLPYEIRYRKKSPYPKTYDPAYLDMVSKLFTKMIVDPSQPIHEIINKDALNSLFSDSGTWPWYGQLMRKPQTMAYMLQINYWLVHYRIDIVC